MKIYLAARYGRRGELCRYAEELRALGHEVTSTWLEGNHQAQDHELEDDVALAVRLAADDLKDLGNSDMVISFTEEPRVPHGSRGGRHVEFGVALALNIAQLIVGPREHVFHAFAVQVDSWPEALERLCDIGCCRKCGCTELSACVVGVVAEGEPETCHWIEPKELCSACSPAADLVLAR